MKKLLWLGAVCLFVGTTATTLSGGQDRGGSGDIRDQFVGAWRLAWLEEPDADGKVHRADCTGLLVYTRDGHMSVQVMYKNPPAGTSAAPVQYAQGGYEASFGTYEIDESTHTFSFHVEGALVRTLIGKDLPRAFELSGKQLIVKSTHPGEHWRVAWEHY
jgi:hypothetical protein